jgi:hypothetical protein
MKPNAEWHRAHRMPTTATREERVEWHLEHAITCGCRPVPPGLAVEVDSLKRKRGKAG